MVYLPPWGFTCGSRALEIIFFLREKKRNPILGKNSRLSKMTAYVVSFISLLSAYISLPSDHHVTLQSETTPANQASKNKILRIRIKFLYPQKKRLTFQIQMVLDMS